MVKEQRDKMKRRKEKETRSKGKGSMQVDARPGGYVLEAMAVYMCTGAMGILA